MATRRPEAALEARVAELERWVAGHRRLLVAASGGGDSTFFASVAQRALGAAALAVTVDMAAVPARTLARARALAASLGLRRRVLRLEPQGVVVSRARHHGPVLRVDLGEDELPRLADDSFRQGLAAAARQAGFRYAAADVEPDRTGRRNPPRRQQPG